MQRYSCPNCGIEVHFDNSACVNCGRQLGYEPSRDQILAADSGELNWRSPDGDFNPCTNRRMIACNWLTPASDQSGHCVSCQHTRLIPDLSWQENIQRWSRLERAKRALFYSIQKFNLPLQDLRYPGSDLLTFEFKADMQWAGGWKTPVLTGHDNGLVTINIAEADDAVRERQRRTMGEPYRTLMGHFRHEIGHYYWDRLVAANYNTASSFRTIFGDENMNYSNALQRHYQFGPSSGWEQSYVSAYASSHPWEDFAETWAHYFHIVDGIETARSYGLNFGPRHGEAGESATRTGAYAEQNLRNLIDEWVPLTVAMNAMNRSIGNSDFYPFVLSETIFTKLHFVHGLIHTGR